MAAKVFFLLALIAVVVAAEDCTCDPPNQVEDQALWQFLTKLSSESNESETEENDMRAVLPGILSPLLDCNCLEKNRTKRKIMPEESEEVTTEASGSLLDEFVREKKSIHYKSKRCPHGYVWVGLLCVREEYLE